LTSEEINHDRQKLSETLRNEVADDLGRLGLQVDTFKIQHVTDEVRYLDSISRVRIAEVLRDAEIAESNATREAEQAIAAAMTRGQVATERAGAAIAEKEAQLALVRAEFESRARSEEERTLAAAREAGDGRGEAADGEKGSRGAAARDRAGHPGPARGRGAGPEGGR